MRLLNDGESSVPTLVLPKISGNCNRGQQDFTLPRGNPDTTPFALRTETSPEPRLEVFALCSAKYPSLFRPSARGTTGGLCHALRVASDTSPSARGGGPTGRLS